MANIPKRVAKRIIPKSIQGYLRKASLNRALKRHDKLFSSRSTNQIFATIYSKRMWGESDLDAIFSGNSSHELAHVSTYVKAVQSFLGLFEPPLNVVDLGCGDFNIRPKVRSLAKTTLLAMVQTNYSREMGSVSRRLALISEFLIELKTLAARRGGNDSSSVSTFIK